MRIDDNLRQPITADGQHTQASQAKRRHKHRDRAQWGVVAMDGAIGGLAHSNSWVDEWVIDWVFDWVDERLAEITTTWESNAPTLLGTH